MAKLSLPIPSQVPLDVLRKDTLSIIEEMHDSGNTGFVGVRLMNGCQNAGLDRLWMFATIAPWVLLKRKNFGKKTLRLAEEVLKKSGCSFQMFPELRTALEEVATSSGKASNRHWLSISEVFMALNDFGSWAKDEAIKSALAEHGLRPGMPIEELFVYVPAITEPKKLTVAEELLAFGAMSAWSVLPASDTDLDLNPDRTIIELWAELAVWPEPASPIIVQRRNELIAAARRHLSPEALMRIGYVEE